MTFDNASLFPMGSTLSENGHLNIGGCDVTELAKEYGTPLYIYDEATIRTMAKTFVKEFGTRYTNTVVAYASKAFLTKAMARIANEEGLSLDVVSGGEIAAATVSYTHLTLPTKA